MQITIAGAGETGHFIAEDCLNSIFKQTCDITIIDRNKELLEEIQYQLDVKTIQGSCTDQAVFEQLASKNNDLFVACTDRDEINLISCILARQYGFRKTIAIIHSPVFSQRKVIGLYQHSGVDHLINPAKALANEILETTLLAGLANEATTFVNRKVFLLGYQVHSSSVLVNLVLKQNTKDRPPFLVSFIIRGQNSFIPDGSSKILAGDYIYLLVSHKELENLKQFLHVGKETTRKAVIAGNPSLLLETTKKLLRQHFEIQFIGPEFSQSLVGLQTHKKKLSWVPGRIDSVHSQLKADVANCSLFIAADQDDKLNLTGGMIAHYLGAKKTMVLLQRPDLATLPAKLGIDTHYSPRLIIARQIKKLLQFGTLNLDLTTLANTPMEVLSLQVHKNAPVVGKLLSTISFPKNCLVGTIVSKKQEVLLPSGTSSIMPDDQVIVLTMPENVAQLKKMISAEG